MRPSKTEYFLKLADLAATRGTCAKKQVGAVAVDANGIVLAIAYNGQPRGHQHCDLDMPCDAYFDGNLHCRAIHAEMNLLLQVKDVNAIEKVYITEAPCFRCEMLIWNTSCLAIVTPQGESWRTA